MVSISSEHRESGFATPAAAAISLAIVAIAAAVTEASLTALHFERADFARTQARYQMDGGQADAALALLASQNQGPVRWTMVAGGQNVEVIAEPEAQKLGLASGGQLKSDDLGRLDVAAPGAVRAKLAALSAETVQVANLIADADPSPVWRLCARSLISPYGAATTLPTAAWSGLQPNVIGSHTGQLWRIRLASVGGWTDDRIVRFTGSSEEPVAVVADQFVKGRQMGEACDQALDAATPR